MGSRKVNRAGEQEWGDGNRRLGVGFLQGAGEETQKLSSRPFSRLSTRKIPRGWGVEGRQSEGNRESAEFSGGLGKMGCLCGLQSSAWPPHSPDPVVHPHLWPQLPPPPLSPVSIGQAFGIQRPALPLNGPLGLCFTLTLNPDSHVYSFVFLTLIPGVSSSESPLSLPSPLFP